MATPVLATKLFIPPLRALAVSRARLIDRLHEGREAGRKLTLISAPAGFGKTTLLSEWIADTQIREPDARVAWLSLDEGDNDPSRFLAYLLAAMQRSDPGTSSDPPASPAFPARQMELALTDLINQLAQASYRVVLVLDDFQSIEAPSIREALTFLLDHLPSNLHVVIASRSDPLLPVARLRGGGDLNEFRANDLRFTPDEASTFLNRVMGLGLSVEDVAALDTRTEGWIAGLQLAALSMRERSDIAGFIEAFTGSNRFVIDYLGEEVLQHQPDHVRGFLLQTAFLDRLSGPLCEAVTGRADSSELLETLERDNLFLVPLDDRREWYRYHHLFADVLRARSLREDRDGVEALHRLASEWHERNDLPEDAVKHALAGADFARAASLIERALPELRRGRQDATLLGWLRLLPHETARRMPVLGVYYAWSLLISGDLDAVEDRLRDAEHALAATTEDGALDHDSAAGEELESLPVMIAVYRAALAQARGDVAGTREHARRALELTQPGDHRGRGAAGGLLALALWADGDLEAAVRTFADARTSLHLAGSTADMLGSAVVMADMLLVQGRRGRAREAYEQALLLASGQGEPAMQSTGDLHVGMSEVCREEADLEAATMHLSASRALGERASLPESHYRWFVGMARINEAEGELDDALSLLSEAEHLYVPGFLPEVRPIAAMKARIWTAQGKLSEALAWADEQGLSSSDDVSYLREFEHITFARLLVAQHKADQREGAIRDALALLERLLEAAQAGGRMGSVNEILVVQALAYQAQGRRSQAVASLARALAQAEPEGYIRLFVDEGAPMAALLEEAAHEGIARGYVHRLHSAFLPSRNATTVPQSNAAALSEREMHVLRLLTTELSGPQIARELFVSLNTFRTHTKHIFGKLGVNSRPGAIRRAQELGLL
ncbi:LuxR C-terminal-related transcriptional regulator [Agromyces sp. Soil535]|uniref:LuxR C-terminal-related transcriptional regulator n=1 Tax=Agromyces sp. Soil535 TaxID=1736390 RepID=UPI0006FBF6EE|nr:LuxR C-terminal-related transcriptional regulator [Agromyces sp. Soil535]KRE25847.1 hypothetical protein ASG80_21915 [Agromyces sp. Soil535]